MVNLRLFIAIETPEDVKKQIIRVQQRLRQSSADVRWEPPEKLHATVKFLGDTSDVLLPKIFDVMEISTRRSSPIEIRYSGVGRFPSRGEPRVVWIGIDDPAKTLLHFFTEIETGMADLGFKKEDRPFRPHVTLGRVKGNRNLRGLISTMESITFECQPVLIHHVAVIKSELKPSGSVYTSLKTFPLST